MKTDLESELLRVDPVTGRCYVLTFSEKHHVTLADMTPKEILPVIEAWTRVYASHLSPSNPLSAVAAKLPLLQRPSAEQLPSRPTAQLRYMQIFENKGAAMGCSNPHPHCQVWTTSTLPEEPGKELVSMAKYRKEHAGRHLLGDYVKLELEKQERIVWQNDAFLVVCPWWAIWPFEVLILAKRHVRALVDLTDEERFAFAEAIQEVTRRYDNLFECSFPYSASHPPKWSRVRKRLMRPNRFGPSPSAAGLHGGRGREQLLPYALLPTAAAVCHRAKVPCWVRADGRAPARHYSGAGRCSTEESGRRAI